MAVSLQVITDLPADAVTPLDVVLAINETSGPTTELKSTAIPSSLYETYPTGVTIARIISTAVLVLGFPGNFLSAVVWLRLTTRDGTSSGVYLAALAISDSVFLCAYLLQLLYFLWDVRLLACPYTFGVCFVALMSAHYMSVLLVLAFNVDRYLAIKYPLQASFFIIFFT